MNLLYVLQRQSFGLQNYVFCLKMFELHKVFDSAGESFQSIVPIELTVSIQNLLVLMFSLFTVTPDLRLHQLFSLKRKISLIMRGERTFVLYISVLANILYFYD